MSYPGCVPAIVFNYGNWVARYPEFSNVTQEQAQGYFDEATIYCANKLGPIPTTAILTVLLYMLTAHIAAIYSNPTGAATPSNQPPGRISQASEGSVNVSFDLSLPAQAQFFAQTKYGLSYWQASAQYRQMQYRVAGGPQNPTAGAWLYPQGWNN